MGRQQECFGPALLRPQLAGQELGSRLPLSQLGPGHCQEAQGNQAGLVLGTSVQSSHNAIIETHLDYENFKTVTQNNAVGVGRGHRVLPCPPHGLREAGRNTCPSPRPPEWTKAPPQHGRPWHRLPKRELEQACRAWVALHVLPSGKYSRPLPGMASHGLPRRS
jgi:hypothetical protein